MTFAEQILLVISVTIGVLSLLISGYNSKDISELQRENWRLKDRVHFLELNEKKRRIEDNDARTDKSNS